MDVWPCPRFKQELHHLLMASLGCDPQQGIPLLVRRAGADASRETRLDALGILLCALQMGEGRGSTSLLRDHGTLTKRKRKRKGEEHGKEGTGRHSPLTTPLGRCPFVKELRFQVVVCGGDNCDPRVGAEECCWVEDKEEVFSYEKRKPKKKIGNRAQVREYYAVELVC